MTLLQGIEHFACHMHDAQAVLKSGVRSSGVDQVLHSKLPYIAESLENGMINNPPFVGREADESVDRTANPQRRFVPCR